MTVIESINQFCTYFDHQIAAIRNLTISPLPDNMASGSGSISRYKKVLYVTAIDTLAGFRYHKSVYPQMSRQNRERFIRFINEHASWSEGELVSLPFLRDELEKLNLLQRPLGQHITKKLYTFSTEDGGAPLVKEIDEATRDLLKLASNEKEEEAIRDYRHHTLLYRYRNSLVHDSNEPGNTMEFLRTSDAPYYHSYIGDPKWYLVYPLSLFELLLKQAIQSFQIYLTSNSIDPYSLIEEKIRW